MNSAFALPWGAQRKQVLQAALGRTLQLLAGGALTGMLLGMAASRVLSYFVYEATPRDPAVLAGVILTMLLLGLLAATFRPSAPWPSIRDFVARAVTAGPTRLLVFWIFRPG